METMIYVLFADIFLSQEGKYLRWIISLLVIFSSIPLLLIQSNSFTTTVIKNDAELSIAAEENALIGLSYGKANLLAVTNNSANPIEIESIELLNHSVQILQKDETDLKLIPPGKTKEFTITGDPRQLIGGIIKINCRWEGGSAQIKSTIPELIGEE
jgi:hypothetical protein